MRRSFPATALEAIERAIRISEATHDGEIRFAVESAFGAARLFRGQTAGHRASELFSTLRVWDTERNNGILIYVLLADREIVIVADRAVNAMVGAAAWAAACRAMEYAFVNDRFEEGAVAGIHAVSEHLAKHFPRRAREANELPDAPVLL